MSASVTTEGCPTALSTAEENQRRCDFEPTASGGAPGSLAEPLTLKLITESRHIALVFSKNLN